MDVKTTTRLLKRYEEDNTIQNYIAQANSRFILYNANEPFENFPKYTSNLDERCLHIAFSYLNLGWYFFIGEDKNKAIYCVEKAAEILEHLYAYIGCRKEYKEFYNLTCALAYYIASQYSKAFIVLKYYSHNTQLAKMLKLFLTRNFEELEETLKYIEFFSDPTIEEIESEVYTKILSKSISEMIQFIFNGDKDRLVEAKQILLDLIQLSQINNESHLWWIFRLLYLVFGEYEEASLWTILPPIIENHEKCNEYIRTNIYKQTPVVELFKSQRDCLYKSLNNNAGGVAIGMSTSSGKTKIAEIAIIKSLIEDPNSLCIYIAPFRSLANEIEYSLSNTLNSMGYILSNLYGSGQATQIDKQLINESNVVVATPEKIKSILRANPDIEERIKLLIVDEGHLVGGEFRYITSELLIEEIKLSIKKNDGKIILLSAVLPNLSDFGEWVGGSKGKIAKSSWRPSAQRFGELEFINNTVNLKWEGDPPSFNARFIDSEIVNPRRKTKTGKVYRATYFPKDKKEAVGATAVKMLSMGSVLIYVGRTNMVLSQARIVSKLLEQKNIIHYWKNKNDLNYVKLACEEAYGKDSEIYSLLLQGIICHSSKISRDVRQGIEKLMSNGNPKIIVATSTLGQGVNIGVSTAIISNIYFNQNETLDVKDFWNISGRAGRAFADTEGKILFAIDKHKGNYSIQTQLNQKEQYFEEDNIENAESGVLMLLTALYKIAKECEIDYESFLELLSENVDIVPIEQSEIFFGKTNFLLDLIDDTLISMSLKKEVQGLQDNAIWIEEIFRQSLAYIQAKNSTRITQEQVIEILKARSQGAIKLAGTYQKCKYIVCSSVPVRASLFIDENLEEIRDHVSKYIYSEQEFIDLINLLEYLNALILQLPINIDLEFIEVDNLLSITEKWYKGVPMNEIKKIDKKADIVCNQYYGFHFPWIINSISKKIKLWGKIDESTVLEEISLISEIGVPNIKSAKIYLAGIRSRESAIELSTFVDTDIQINIKDQLLNVFSSLQSEQISCSERTYRWLILLNERNKYNSAKKIKKIVINISEKKTGKYKELLVKNHNNKMYICSYNYNIKLPIRKEFYDKYKDYADIQGIFFKKISQDKWELSTRNPYIQIID